MSSASSARRVLQFAFALLFVFSACAFDYAADTGADLGERITKSFKLNAGGTVSIEHDRGSIKLDGWDKNEVSVEAVKHFEGDQHYRDEWMRETKVNFDSQADHLRVTVERPHYTMCFTGCNFRAWVDLTLHVPRHVALDMNVDRNDVRVESIQGEVKIEAERTPIVVRDVVGGFRISSSRGSVTMRDVEAPNGLRVQAERGSMEIEASNLKQGADLSADRGNIRLRIPESEHVSVDVQRDRRAGFSSDFPLTTNGNLSGYGRFHGDINGGGPSLRMRTERGAISLEKGFTRSGKLF